MTLCLSSFAFMRTIDRLAEESDAKMTKSLPVIPNDTVRTRQSSRFSFALRSGSPSMVWV